MSEFLKNDHRTWHERLASRRLLLLLALIVCSGSISAHSSKASNSKRPAGTPVLKDVLLLHQVSSTLGTTSLFLAKDAGRFEAHNGKMIASCCAPKWDIVFYSNSKKLIYAKPRMGKEGDNLQFFDTPLELSNGQISRKKSSTLHLDYKEIFVDGSKVKTAVSDPVFFQDRSRRVVSEVVCRVADIGQIKPELQNFIWFVFGHRDLPGVLIDLKVGYIKGKTDNALSTLSVEKIRKPNSFFAPPVGFGKTSDKQEISYSDDYKSTIDDLFSTSAPVK